MRSVHIHDELTHTFETFTAAIELDFFARLAGGRRATVDELRHDKGSASGDWRCPWSMIFWQLVSRGERDQATVPVRSRARL
jgi:hypothetical protein